MITTLPRRISTLTAPDLDALILAALAAGPTTEAQLVAFLDWADEVVTMAALVELAKKGLVSVDVSNEDRGEWEWRRIGEGVRDE